MKPHEAPEFANAATYTVAITYTVRGGARRRTAHRRAEKVAERVANAAARLGDVVEVTATAGGDAGGKKIMAKPVRFTAANTGHSAYGEPGKLPRYLDHDHERALASRAQADAEAQALRTADRERRSAVRCANRYSAWMGSERRRCHCLYCEPEEHYRARQTERRWPGCTVTHLVDEGRPSPARAPRRHRPHGHDTSCQHHTKGASPWT